MRGVAVLRSVLATLALVMLGACSGGVDAGEDGGMAFVLFTGMLIAVGAVLWFILGREE
jgi:hypothetical protein